MIEKYDRDLTSDPEKTIIADPSPIVKKVSRSCSSDHWSYDPNALAPVRILLNI